MPFLSSDTLDVQRRRSSSLSDLVSFKKVPDDSQPLPANRAKINDLQGPMAPESNKLSYRRPAVYKRLYIAESELAYQWAIQKLRQYRWFQLIYEMFVLVFDCRSHRIWDSVLLADTVIDNNQELYVTDTLILHCLSTKCFERLIPLIRGPFSRLSVHGSGLKVDQIYRLLRDNVKSVEITAEIHMEHAESEIPFAVEMVIQHVQFLNNQFTLSSTPILRTEIQTACKNQWYHYESTSDTCVVRHWKSVIWGVLYHFYTFAFYYVVFNYFMLYILGIPEDNKLSGSIRTTLLTFINISLCCRFIELPSKPDFK